MPSLFDLLRPRPREDRLERAIRDGERYLRERPYVAAERAFDFATKQNPTDPRAYLWELVTESLLQRVLPMMQLNYGWILVDAPPDVGDRALWLLERARLVLLVASPDQVGYQAMRGAIQVCETLHVPSHRRRLIWHATRGQPRGVGETIADRFPAETHRFLPYAGEDFLPEIQSGQPLVLRKPQHRWSRDLANLTNEFAV